MAGDWVSTNLGEVITLKRGYDLPLQDRKNGPHPIVSSSGVTGWHDEAKVSGPGVVTGRYGTLGEVYFLEEDFWPLNTTLYVKDFKGNDPRFISYFLRGLNYLAHSDKSSVPGINRNHLHAEKIEFPFDVEEQQKIVQVLIPFDDKIDLNRQINHTLEQMAQTFFKSWFIDFDPVVYNAVQAGNPVPEEFEETAARYRDNPAAAPLPQEILGLFPDRFTSSVMGQVPAGWDCVPLDTIANFLNGLACQKYPTKPGRPALPVIKIRELRNGFSAATDQASGEVDEKYIVNDGDVLFSWSGSLLVDVWAQGVGILNQHVFKITSSKYPRWFVYYWTLHHLECFRGIAADKATTMGHIKRHHLSEAKVNVPDPDTLEKLDHYISPFLDRQVINNIESRYVRMVRDTLLPKLISGELRVDGVGNI